MEPGLLDVGAAARCDNECQASRSLRLRSASRVAPDEAWVEIFVVTGLAADEAALDALDLLATYSSAESMSWRCTILRGRWLRAERPRRWHAQ